MSDTAIGSRRNGRPRRVGVALLVALCLSPATVAQELDVTGSAAVDLRTFVTAAQFPGQLEHLQPSLVLSPELQLRTADRRHQFRVTPFARLDGSDGARTHLELHDAFWRGVFGDWDVLVGAQVVFAGVTESRHLVNIVNQTDLREDIDEEDKLGQPMVSIEWQRAWGRVSGMALLGFRERPFPGAEGRLRGVPRVAVDKARFTDGKRAVDLFVRYSHFIEGFDVGVSAFHGNSREPAFLPGGTGATLVPTYRTITQLGLDLQYTRNAWLWKLETISRHGEGRAFGAVVGGFEYTRYQIFDSAVDLGMLGEYLFDDRDDRAPPTPFDNDLFVGTRVALNDARDTALLVGAVMDAADGTIAARVEGSRRLTDGLTVDIESRLFGNVGSDNLLNVFRHESFLTVTLGLHF